MDQHPTPPHGIVARCITRSGIPIFPAPPTPEAADRERLTGRQPDGLIAFWTAYPNT